MKIALVEDHTLMRDGLTMMLSGEPDLEVVATIPDGETALTRLLTARPDLLVIDIGLPGIDGIEVAGLVRRHLPETRILALSMYADASLVRRMLEAGAGGYVLKNATPDQLKAAVRKVAAGGRWFSAGLGVDEGLDGRDLPEALSRRERQVLESIARGRKTGETADELGLSPKTVETYRRRLMQKLGIESVAGLVVYALKTGVVGLDVFAEQH